jgi:hypothetical protein
MCCGRSHFIILSFPHPITGNEDGKSDRPFLLIDNLPIYKALQNLSLFLTGRAIGVVDSLN